MSRWLMNQAGIVEKNECQVFVVVYYKRK